MEYFKFILINHVLHFSKYGHPKTGIFFAMLSIYRTLQTYSKKVAWLPQPLFYLILFPNVFPSN